MKPKKPEIIIIAVTVAAVIFTGGFFAGRATVKTAVSIYTAPSEKEVLDVVPAPPSPSAQPDGEQENTVVNINTASAEELSQLPGIGDVLAQRIVDFRTQYGAFRSIDSIMDVEGVGEGKYDGIKDFISVS